MSITGLMERGTKVSGTTESSMEKVKLSTAKERAAKEYGKMVTAFTGKTEVASAITEAPFQLLFKASVLILMTAADYSGEGELK